MSELPDGWFEVPIGEVNFYKSKNVDPKKYPNDLFELYSVPIFPEGKPEEIIGNEIGSTKQTVEKGDVLLCKINPRINRVWQVGGESDKPQIASSEWIVFRNEYFNSNFIHYAFRRQEFRELLCSEVSGVGGSLTRAQPKKVATYSLPVAPINEQIRIANKLDQLLTKVDSAKTRLDKIPAILKRFRQSVLAAATSGQLTEEWREEKDVNLKKITLGDAGVFIKTGPFGSALHKKDYIEEGVHVINPMHIRDGQIFPSSSMTISLAKFDELKTWELKQGDVIVGRRGEMGRAAEVRSSSQQLLCGTGSMIIRTEESGLLPAFLCLILRAPLSVAYFESNSVGSTMVNLNQKIIKSLTVDYPLIEEQKEIVRRVNDLFSIADQIEKQYNTAKARVDKLTQSILAKAFRGDLVPQNPKDESAEKLLDRIKEVRLADKKIKPEKRIQTKAVKADLVSTN